MQDLATNLSDLDRRILTEVATETVETESQCPGCTLDRCAYELAGTTPRWVEYRDLAALVANGRPLRKVYRVRVRLALLRFGADGLLAVDRVNDAFRLTGEGWALVRGWNPEFGRCQFRESAEVTQ